MDALKKAEAANKERTPPELPISDPEAHPFFTKETTAIHSETLPTAEASDEEALNLLDWEAESETTLSIDEKGGFDWLNAEISLSTEDIITPPDVAKIPPATPEFFIDEPEVSEDRDEFVLENFEVEDPASTPELSEELIAAALQEEVFTPAAVKPSNSIEFTPPVNKTTTAENISQPTPENINTANLNTANQEAAQRIFNARQQHPKPYRIALYAILGLVILGIIGVYAYSFLFINTPSVGLTRYPVNNTVNISQNPPPAATPPNNPNVINNTATPVAAPVIPSPPPANNAANFPPIVPMFPPINATEKIEKNGVSSPNGANDSAKTLKSVQKNAAVAPEKITAPLQGTEQLTGMLSLKKDSLTHASQDLSSAYQALQQGNLSHSERAYKKVLQYDGRNRDALLGLAAIALQQGRVAQAQHYYQQILQSYPQDSLAQAGLISSLGERSPDASVSQLKTMLSQLSPKAENLPQVAYLQFTLGNVYARQQAWTEAQQAYFEAYRTEPRADYAYNLAISLDQLHQYPAAANYYQQALQLGQSREKSGFDRQAAAQRLQELTASRGIPNVSPVE
jgi:Tfp pilus assembly protein PilF